MKKALKILFESITLFYLNFFYFKSSCIILIRMLEPLRHVLNSKEIILASASARRKEIFEMCFALKPKVLVSTFPEDLNKADFPNSFDYAIENSKIKALEVAEQLKNKDDWLFVVGADTVVVLENTIYEKPVDKKDAFRILKLFVKSYHILLLI